MSEGKNVFEGKPDTRQSADVNAKVSPKVSRFWPTYRWLTEDEKKLHDEIKAKAIELEALIEKIAAYHSQPTSQPPEPPIHWGRYIALAQTDLESSIMWAVKALKA